MDNRKECLGYIGAAMLISLVAYGYSTMTLIINLIVLFYSSVYSINEFKNFMISIENACALTICIIVLERAIFDVFGSIIISIGFVIFDLLLLTIIELVYFNVFKIRKAENRKTR